MGSLFSYPHGLKTMKRIITTLLILPVTASLATAQISVSTLTRTPANGGITIASDGDIIVAEYGNYVSEGGTRVFRFTPDGESTLIAENIGFSNSGNDFDSAGNLIQASWNSGRLTRITPEGDASLLAISPGPVGVVVAPNDDIFFTQCREGDRIRRIPASFVFGDIVENFSEHSSFNCPNGLTMDENGNLYTVNWHDGLVFRIDQDGEATVLADIPGGAGHLVYANNRLYVAGRTMNRIYSVDLEGNITELAGTGGVGDNDGTADVATFSRPNGIAASNDGKLLYVSGTVFATVSGGGSDNAIRIVDLGISDPSENSTSAILDGINLTIPVLVAGEQTFSITLTLDTTAETPELVIASYQEISATSDTNVSTFADNILTIPSVLVDGIDYWARFQLSATDTSRFILLSADLNDSENDDAEDGSDDSLYNTDQQ